MNKLTFFSLSDYPTVTFLIFREEAKVSEVLATKNADGVWEGSFPTLTEGVYVSVAITNDRVLGEETIYWDSQKILDKSDYIAKQISQTQSSLTPEQSKQLTELYTLMGLDPTKPLIVNRTKRIAGQIDQDILDIGTQTTVTRR